MVNTGVRLSASRKLFDDGATLRTTLSRRLDEVTILR